MMDKHSIFWGVISSLILLGLFLIAAAWWQARPISLLTEEGKNLPLRVAIPEPEIKPKLSVYERECKRVGTINMNRGKVHGVIWKCPSGQLFIRDED